MAGTLPGGRRGRDFSSQVLELDPEIRRRLVASICILLETAPDDPGEVAWKIPALLEDMAWNVSQDRREELRGRRTPKRSPAGSHLVEDAAEREDVRSVVGIPTLRLFRRQIWQRPQKLTFRRHVFCRPLLGLLLGRYMAKFGQAEIQHLHPPGVSDHDVCRLEIAVG